MNRIVVKIGTSVITKEDGSPDEDVMKNLVAQIVQIKRSKIDVAVISSGAVAFGKRLYQKNECVKNKFLDSQKKTAQRQAYASMGQVSLMNTYFDLFLRENFFCAQVLATREDFRSRKHYLNMRDCINTLLTNHIVPILNENDVVAVDELMFSDNDELAGMTAAMIEADMLVILSNVDGLYDGDPDNPEKKVLHEIAPDYKLEKFISHKKSTTGRGGMLTKCKVAKKLSKIGIETYLVNGKHKNVLIDIFEGKKIGTHFLTEKKVSAVKKWMAISRGIEKGAIIVNKGAEEAIKKGASILPVGVIDIEGEFEKDDVVIIKNDKLEKFGVGIVKQNSEEAKLLIGKKGEKPLVRRDFLFLNISNE